MPAFISRFNSWTVCRIQKEGGAKDTADPRLPSRLHPQFSWLSSLGNCEPTSPLNTMLRSVRAKCMQTSQSRIHLFLLTRLCPLCSKLHCQDGPVIILKSWLQQKFWATWRTGPSCMLTISNCALVAQLLVLQLCKACFGVIYITTHLWAI